MTTEPASVGMQAKILALNLARRVLKLGPYARPRMLRDDKVVLLPFPVSRPWRDGRIALVLHIYHPDLAPALRVACEHVTAPADVLVTTDSEDKALAIQAAFDGWPHGAVTVSVGPNRGRDMPSKFVAFRDVLPDYALVLFLHSKKSHHMHAGEHDWGEMLAYTVAGSTAVVDSVLALFAADPRLGVVYPDHYDELRPYVGWAENRRRTAAVAARIGVDLDRARALEFPSGSMFWARPEALRPLLDLELSHADFDPEQGQLDNTLAHALERLILFSAEKMGFWWLKVVTERHHTDRGNRISVNGGGDVTPDAIVAARARLTGDRARTVGHADGAVNVSTPE